MPILPSSGRLLALDWGEVRIGLALSDETQTLATPTATLVRRAGKRLPMPGCWSWWRSTVRSAWS